MKQTGGGSGGKGHTSKHAGTHKHHAHGAKHHPKRQPAHSAHKGGTKTHVKAHHAKHPRGLAIGDLLPVCTFEALAMSLRLAGQPVHEDDVAELWTLAGAREVTIAEALDAAAEYGLGSAGPGRVHPVRLPPFSAVAIRPGYRQVYGAVQAPQQFPAYGLILGVDLPGYHAVLATPDGWWSWGRLRDPSWFPHAVIEEAWAVSWS